MTRPLPLPVLWRVLPLAGKLALAALAVAAAGLTSRLWPQWRSNPDLSHGYFMPVLFFLLLNESRSGTPRYLKPGVAGNLGLATLLGGGLLALVTAGLYAASVDWSHALVNLMLALSFTLFTGATAAVFARNSVRLIGFNWPIMVAAGLWLLATPIPPGTYTRLTLTLQLWVSEGVLRTLHLLGIAAIRHGNIIDLANTTVGIEEACSGVRSLISCVFAGVFFSATLVRRPWARALLIALAAPLALAMNFLRSLFLTLLANNNVNIAGTWHDVTGFAVLGLTAVVLGVLAVLLEQREGRAATVPDSPAPMKQGVGAHWVLAAGFAGAATLISLFVLNTRPSSRTSAPPPDLQALLPASPSGWQMRSTDLFEFRGTLRTEHLAQRAYFRPATPESPSTEILIYVAYWHPGQAPVSLVASHTPDACWPGSGWNSVPNAQPRTILTAARRSLPAAEYRVFESRGRPHHVWYWHLHDGQPLTYRDPYSAVELLRIAWKFGFRRDGDQFFVRVSSNRPWAEIQHETVLGDFFVRTQSLGL